MLSKKVMDKVTPPKVSKPELRILTGDEVQYLLRNIEGTDYHMPVHLALRTGARRSDLCGLFWCDLNLEESSLRVMRTMVSLPGQPAHLDDPKSQRSRRVVALGEETAELLKDWRAVLGGHAMLGRSQVCARRGGSDILPDVLPRRFSAIIKACKIEGARFPARDTPTPLSLGHRECWRKLSRLVSAMPAFRRR